MLAQERARNQELEQQLAAREDEQKLLAQERARNQELEQKLAAHQDDQKVLAQERARIQALELQLAVRRDATAHCGLTATASPSDRPALMLPAPAPDKPVTAPLPTSDKPMMPGNHKSPTLTARLTAREAPGNVEAARLMTQARLLLDQGKIIAARSVLERAAASGSALALFLLAETYDPAILSEWGIFRQARRCHEGTETLCQGCRRRRSRGKVSIERAALARGADGGPKATTEKHQIMSSKPSNARAPASQYRSAPNLPLMRAMSHPCLDRNAHGAGRLVLEERSQPHGLTSRAANIQCEDVALHQYGTSLIDGVEPSFSVLTRFQS